MTRHPPRGIQPPAGLPLQGGSEHHSPEQHEESPDHHVLTALPQCLEGMRDETIIDETMVRTSHPASIGSGLRRRPLYSGLVSRIDLRSDTVTKPTEAMRRAMAEADVGDDWYGDDPTVNRLEERSAQITGMEAACYVATGTMANEIAMHIFVRSGHLVACEATSHVCGVEVSSAAAMSGIAFARIEAPRGQLTSDMVAEALQPDPYDVEVVDLLSLENTHQVGGGTVMPMDELRAIRKVAVEAVVPVYLDGARIFNASVASGTPVGDYTAEVDRKS